MEYVCTSKMAYVVSILKGLKNVRNGSVNDTFK